MLCSNFFRAYENTIYSSIIRIIFFLKNYDLYAMLLECSGTNKRNKVPQSSEVIDFIFWDFTIA